MSDSTTYIFLPTDDEAARWIHAALCFFSGGYKLLTGKVRFVMAGTENADSEKRADELIRLYQTCHSIASGCQTSFFSQAVDGLCVLHHSASQDDLPEMLKAVSEKALPSWHYRKCLRLFDDTEIGNGDRFVAVAHTGDMKTLALPLALSNMSWAKNMQTICQIAYSNNDEERKSYFYTAYTILPPESTIFTGVRDDTYRYGMTFVLTTTAILVPGSSPISGQPILKGGADGLGYTEANLPSADAATALARLAALESVENECEDTTLNKFLGLFAELRNSIPRDHFSIYIQNKDKLVRNIEQGRKTKGSDMKGSTEEEKKRKRLVALFNSIEKSFKYDKSTDKSYGWRSAKPAPNGSFFSYIYSQPLSCAAMWWLATETAFATNCMDVNEAKKVRSYCLDLWEIMFKRNRQEANKALSVHEFVLAQEESFQAAPLAFLPVGDAVLSENIIYRIDINEKPFAYTSPLTGFALCGWPANTIVINNKKYFDDFALRDLSEREPDFQALVYDYVRTMLLKSQHFRDYVERQLESAFRHRCESKGNNLFKIYPQFRKHIGVNIVDNKQSNKN